MEGNKNKTKRHSEMVDEPISKVGLYMFFTCIVNVVCFWLASRVDWNGSLHQTITISVFCHFGLIAALYLQSCFRPSCRMSWLSLLAILPIVVVIRLLGW